MKKIMFNTKYLEPLVLNGTKTMTRRVVPGHLVSKYKNEFGSMDGFEEWAKQFSPYKVGEVVAIAQSYVDASGSDTPIYTESMKAGLHNKMFVKASLMTHHIRITNIKVERLQDISDEDCLKEGVRLDYDPMNIQAYIAFGISWHYTIRDAFKEIIDKCCKPKGLWEQNPMVIAIEFVNID